MKLGKLIALLVVAAALVVGAYMAYNKHNTSTGREDGGIAPGKPLLAKLPERVGDVARIEIRSEDDSITLVRDDNHNWTVETSGNYPAKAEKVTELVFNLTGLTVGDMVTARQEKYKRFGLEGEVGEEGAIVVADKAAQPIVTLVRGAQRDAPDSPEAGGRPGGRYVRTPPDPHVYLVSENFYGLGARLRDWIDTEVANVTPDEIIALDIDHGTTESVSLVLDDKQGLTVADIPEDMQVKKYEVNSTRDAMAPLRIEDVLAADSEEAKGIDFSTTYTAKLKTGAVYTVRAGEREGKEFVAVAADYGEMVLLDSDKATTATEAKAREAAEKAKAGIPSFNERHAPWVYQVSDWTGKRFMARRSTMLEPKKEEPKPAGKPAARADKAEQNKAAEKKATDNKDPAAANKKATDDGKPAADDKK